MPQKMAKFENCDFLRQTFHLPASEVPHGFDLVRGVFNCRIAKVIEQLHAGGAQHGGQRVRGPARPTFGVVWGYLSSELLPGNQLVHPFQKDLAESLELLVLVLGFGEGHLIHGGNESYVVGGGRIIADFETYSESP